ncbi:hypothetical protein ACROYT_G010593 [Oculina patagonica]
MGAGGVSGELRDHSEHVDAILRSHFNVTNGRPSTISSASSRASQASSSSFTFPEDVLEEMACFSCSSNFTLFKRKNLCRNCKRQYCNDCFTKEPSYVPGENSRHCLTCRALQSPIAYKDHLMKLKVKDLQDYLRARQISLNHCKEKRDLVELILRHVEGRSNAAPSSTSHSQHGRQQPQANPSQSHPQNFHFTRINRPRGSNFQTPSNNTRPVQVSRSVPPASQSKSLSEIQNIDEVEELSVKELKHILSANFVDFKGCVEKKELLERVRTLWNSKQAHKKKGSTESEEDIDSEDQFNWGEEAVEIWQFVCSD